MRVGSDAPVFGTDEEPLSEGLKPSFLSPMLAPSKPKSSLRVFFMDYLQRIFSNTEKREDCLFYLGVKDRDGYGFITTGPRNAKKRIRVHRYVCEHYKGKPSSADLFALHSCDNPSCVNPDHLSWGTHQENRRQARDRLCNLKGQKLTLEKVAMLREFIGSNSEAAFAFGISRSHAGSIRKGVYWK